MKRALALFAGLALARVVLLVVSQHSVCGDEAAVGVMAKHVLEGGERPVFAWHEHYNGGAAATAYLASASFALFGMTEPALKLVPLAYSLLAVLVVFLFVRSARGPRDALFAALLYGTSVPLLKWCFDARGGYAECQVLIPLALWLLHGRCLRPGATWRDCALQGALCGLAIYLLPLSLPLALTSAAFLLTRSGLGRVFRCVVTWTAGAALGGAPLVLFHAAGGPLSLDPSPYLARVGPLPVTLWRTFTSYLPGMFAYENLDDYPPLRFAPNLVEYGALLFAIAALVVGSAATLAAFGRAVRERRDEPPPVEVILLGYVVVYLLLYSLHPDAGQEARHLLFLEPALSILAGLGLAAALARGGRFAVAAGLVLAVTACDRAVQYVRLFRDDGVYGPLGRSDPGDADALIAFLDARRVAHVMSEDWDLSWRIVFRTQERITASHSTLWLGRLFREGDLRGGAYALILPPRKHADQRIHRLMRKEGIAEEHLVAGRRVFILRSSP